MRNVEVIVVGGGPAGSAAATRLKRGGAEVLVLDKESFPRLKLCAGWITPQVVSDLQFDPSDYPHSFLSFQRLVFHIKALPLAVPCLQHSIRRFEFDAWLLERSGAEVVRHAVKEIHRDGDGFVVDGLFRCRHLVGAAGTSCPVRRALFNTTQPRDHALQTVTLELEFRSDWQDPDCHLWFFHKGLPGYSWYVPKALGWLNVGVGGMAERMKQRGMSIRQHWEHLTKQLQRFGIRPDAPPTGYSYYLRDRAETAQAGNAYLTGDSAGLATRDLSEGIGPAIRSGHLAAESILHGTPYSLDDVTGASLGGGLISAWMDWAMTRGRGSRADWQTGFLHTT
ncbi:MAG: NAD(P)/FAD-dependent oxidoreductase [Steroidobacterales bacterium]